MIVGYDASKFVLNNFLAILDTPNGKCVCTYHNIAILNDILKLILNIFMFWIRNRMKWNSLPRPNTTPLHSISMRMKYYICNSDMEKGKHHDCTKEKSTKRQKTRKNESSKLKVKYKKIYSHCENISEAKIERKKSLHKFPRRQI